MGRLTASEPNGISSVDFSVVELLSDGRENVLIMIDVFSKYVRSMPTRD